MAKIKTRTETVVDYGDIEKLLGIDDLACDLYASNDSYKMLYFCTRSKAEQKKLQKAFPGKDKVLVCFCW